MMDVNRDGVIDLDPNGPDNVNKDVWEYGPNGTGAIIRYNNDRDSCTDSTDDCSCEPDCYIFDDCCPLDAEDEVVNGPDDVDDLERLVVRVIGSLPADWSIVLAASGPVRIFDALDVNATRVIGGTGPSFHVIDAADASGTMNFGVEATRYPGQDGFGGLVTIGLTVYNEGGFAVCSDKPIRARVAPWMMPSHLDDVTTVYVTDEVGERDTSHPAGYAPSFPNRLTAALRIDPGDPNSDFIFGDPNDPDRVHVIPSSDMWPQDQYEIGFHSAPGDGDERWQSVLLNSPRYRVGGSLVNYALQSLHTAGLGLHGAGPTAWHSELDPRWHNTHDSFGNLEAFPPIPDWPSGYVYHGHEQTDGLGWDAPHFGGVDPLTGEKVVNGMKSELVAFLAEQRVQGNPPHQADTSWLNVAHVDEFISVQRTGPDTFRVILASPQMAIDILEDLILTGEVFDQSQLWVEGHLPFSAHDLLNLGCRRQFNIELQSVINTARSTMETDLGITEFVEVPVFFAGSHCDPTDNLVMGPALAALSDMVNLLSVNNVLIVPNPNPQWDVVDDPFKQAFLDAVLPGSAPGTTVEWIDCLEYHWEEGQVHCATNVRREPREAIRQWWLVEP
jgi:protein-arginine deiminase